MTLLSSPHYHNNHHHFHRFFSIFYFIFGLCFSLYCTYFLKWCFSATAHLLQYTYSLALINEILFCQVCGNGSHKT